MKYGVFLRQIGFLLILIFFTVCTSKVSAQSTRGNYVVIGAFLQEENAREWSKHAQDMGMTAQYALNHNRGLHYVYILKTSDIDEASAKLRELEPYNDFHDAWIYSGDLGKSETMVVRNSGQKINTQSTVAANTEDLAPTSFIVTPADNEDNKPKSDEVVLTKTELREEVYSDFIEEVDDTDKLDVGDFFVFPNLYNSVNTNDVGGQVKVIDVERTKLLQTIGGGEFSNLADPKNGTGKLTMIAEVFGYRKMQHDINYYNPLADTAQDFADLIGDVLVYHYPLVRYHKGDIITMYNVYFYIDAAMMLPESKFELERLLEMMRENKDYRIRIHGHTNGNSAGKIITPGEDGNLFALTEDDEEKHGSAKKLSERRSEIIKEYLVRNGIATDRMEIKAWGGKRMLYDKFSNQAKNNVRVEIEILEE